MRLHLVIGFFILCTPLVTGGVLKGIVKENEESGPPVFGVEISSPGANPTKTLNDGQFQLDFPNLKPGDKVRVVLRKANFVVVNDVQLDPALPSDPENQLLVILICRTEKREEMKRRFYRLKTFEGREAADLRRKPDEARDLDRMTADLARAKPGKTSDLYSQVGRLMSEGRVVEALTIFRAELASLRDDRNQVARAMLEDLLVRLPNPQEFDQEISGERQKLDEAEHEYNLGYELVRKYHFADAIPHLEKALDALPRPACYLALGTALWQLQDLREAERVVRDGLRHVDNRTELEASLYIALAQILKSQGHLEDALEYGERARGIDEKVNGLDDLNVARDANVIGQILLARGGNLSGALEYSQRALKIDEKLYGSDGANVARDLSTIGQIVQAQGDMAGALKYTQRALKIDEKVHGLEHPDVARDLNTIGTILENQGKPWRALEFVERALKIDEKVYGPDHPNVARDLTTIVELRQAQGDLEGALNNSQRALKIEERVYGSDDPKVAIRANTIGTILRAQGDLRDALKYCQRALDIEERVYGSEHQYVARDLDNIGQILKAQGDLKGALAHNLRALTIAEHAYGPDNPATRNIAEHLRALQ